MKKYQLKNIGLASSTSKIEIGADDLFDKIINAIYKKAHTGNPGDGKIFFYDVNEVVKIRTNERVEIAI